MPGLHVTHDADNAGPHILTGKTIDVADSMVLGIEKMVRHDPSLVTLADLPIPWNELAERRQRRGVATQTTIGPQRSLQNLVRSQPEMTLTPTRGKTPIAAG